MVVWNMAFMNFHSVGNVIIPTDELIFFRGVGLNHQLDFDWLRFEEILDLDELGILFEPYPE